MVKAGGSAEAEADLVAEHLVAANLAGHDSHGVGMMPTYVRHLTQGLLVPNTIAMGKVRVAKNEGHQVDPGVLIDSQGRPTRDPHVMYAETTGALLPFGGHKGYALAVVTELLATALSGGPSIHPGNPRAGGIINNMLSILIDPGRFAGVDWFRHEVDGFVDFVKASPPADPKAPVLVPGD